MMDNQGGFIVPETAVIDKPINTRLGRMVRRLGNCIADFGIKIKMLGYYQVTIHPRASLVEMLKQQKLVKDE